MRKEYTVTPKWAWPGSREPVSKFWNPLITFEAIRFRFGTEMETPPAYGI